VKIGHGPATVNGRRASDGASGCESGNLPGLVEAGTLREKECGDWPRYSREAFLLRERILLLARLSERPRIAPVVDTRPPEHRQECLCHLSRGFLFELVLGFEEAG
jgi:hypothetical protein